MKRLLICWGVAAILCLGICGLSAAETIGNTADMHFPSGRGVYSAGLGDFISLNVGFDTEFLLEKEFAHDATVTSNPKLEGVFYSGKFALTLFNRIQPYIKVGMIDGLEMNWSDVNGTMKMEAGTTPVWGGGIKAYLWEFEGMGLKIFSTASFRAAKPDSFRTVSVGGNTGNITNKKLQIFERQAAVGVSREFTVPGYENVSIVPYIGGVWSETSVRASITQGSNIINAGATGQKDNAGLFLGADFLFADNFSLNLEGRFIDQQAVSAGFTALI